MLTCKSSSRIRSSPVNKGQLGCVALLTSWNTVQGQGGGQAIEDGAALGILFDQVHDTNTIEDRLRLFEQVRRDRGSALQVLSNTNPPAPQSVRDAAAKYIPGIKFDSSDDVNEYVFSFDVIAESKAVLPAAAA
jgi:salicylate hydroxylase